MDEQPRVGDPVVLTHSKYRITAIHEGTARLADAGPNWRRTGDVGAVRLDYLAWDPVAGLWRPRPDPDPALADVDQATAFGVPLVDPS